MNDFTPLGHPTWQTITLKADSFVLNHLPRWVSQRREVIHGEVSNYRIADNLPICAGFDVVSTAKYRSVK